MSYHRVNDFRRLAETTSYFSADDSVRPFDLLINSFPHIMQQRSGLAYIDVGSQFVGNRCRQYRDFY